MGKTLGVWIPSLAWASCYLIVITLLTLLGGQHIRDLEEAGIRAVNVDADVVECNPHILVTGFALICGPTSDICHDIGNGVSRVIATGPEQLMKVEGGFQWLLRNWTVFASHLGAAIVTAGRKSVAQCNTFMYEK